MATYDLTVGGTTKLSAANGAQMIKLKKTVDFAATNYSSGDILQLFDIPAGTVVHHIVADVLVAEGAAATVDVGITGVDADGFLDGLSVNSVAMSASTPPALVEGTPNTLNPAYGLGKFFSATDTIDCLLNDDLDAAKVTFYAFCTQP